MKKHDGDINWPVRIGTALLGFLLVAFALVPWAKAQSIWNDVRHEVTLRNDPQSFTCSVVNSTATGLTALGGSCAAPATYNQSIYITDITASASAASTTTADQYLELKSGTGGSCGTGTAVIWATFNPAMGGAVSDLQVPIKVAANSEVCWMDAVAGNKTIIVTGYIK